MEIVYFILLFVVVFAYGIFFPALLPDMKQVHRYRYEYSNLYLSIRWIPVLNILWGIYTGLRWCYFYYDYNHWWRIKYKKVKFISLDGTGKCGHCDAQGKVSCCYNVGCPCTHFENLKLKSRMRR